MAKIKLSGKNIETADNLPETGTIAPYFDLTGKNRSLTTISYYIINPFQQFADSSSKCNFRVNAEEYLIRRFKGETFSWPVV
jgi:hypothetical protein